MNATKIAALFAIGMLLSWGVAVSADPAYAWSVFKKKSGEKKSFFSDSTDEETTEIIKSMMENKNAVIDATIKMMNNQKQDNQRVNSNSDSSR